MEIIDYLRVARRRIWVLIGVPLMAAAAAAGLLLSAQPLFTANSIVAAPALIGGSTSNQYSGSQAVNQFVAQFEATAEGPVVRAAVNKATGVELREIAEGLSVTQVGASSVMSVGFTSSQRANVEPVLNAATKQTLETMFGSQVTLAEQQLLAANEVVQKTNNAIVAWESANKMVDPVRVYQSQLDRINSLQQQQTTMSSNGNLPAAAAVGTAVAAAKADLARFGPLLGAYQVLTAQRDAAVNAVSQTQQLLLTARAQQSAANPSVVTFNNGVRLVDTAATIPTTVLAVTGAAVFLAVALVAMLEMLSRTRAASAQGSPSSGRSRNRSASPHSVQTNGSVSAAASANGRSAPHLAEPDVPAHDGRATAAASSSPPK